MERPDYGIDAPEVYRNIAIAGVAVTSLGFFLWIKCVFPGHVVLGLFLFLWGLSAVAIQAFILVRLQTGKRLHADFVVGQASLSGNEIILDVGTGRGLLLLSAAKKLPTGQAIGIDIWNEKDLTGNRPENALRNAQLEGVSDKVKLLTGDARNLQFNDEHFDVIFSNLCLHNLYEPEDRRRACQEMARVLKKKGRIVLSDFRHISEYREAFEQSGLNVRMIRSLHWPTFPPLRVLIAER